MNRQFINSTGSIFDIDCCPWQEFQFKPKTEVEIYYTDDFFKFYFKTNERKLRAVETKNNRPVCCDSCMEAFIQFSPDTDDRYINIEVNPNGAVYCSVAHCRGNAELIDDDEISDFQVRPTISGYGWEVSYKIPVDFIVKHIPTYEHKKGAVIRANFYKCGDKTVKPHYVTYNNIVSPEPDFHRPEFFAEFELA